MKKSLTLILLVAVLIGGCSKPMKNPIVGHSIIDWVDFVKWDGKSYTRIYNGILRDSDDISAEAVGEVKFRVEGVVTNAKYRTKDGDAAFLDIGTKLYKVKGFSEDELLAARDEHTIGGYRLYAEENSGLSPNLHYNELSKGEVTRIQLFLSGETSAYLTLTNSDKDHFIQLLHSGKDTSNAKRNLANGDPVYYEMVFYTDQPIAYVYPLLDDGSHVYFHPSNTRVIDNKIRNWLRAGHLSNMEE